MARGFWGTVWLGLWKAQLVLGSILAIVLAVALWILRPEQTVPIAWVVLLAVISVILVVGFGNAAYELFRKGRTLPQVLSGRKIAPLAQETELLLLLEPSSLFAHDTWVSFFHIDGDNFERLIGVGSVVNIQEDGRIQVGMSQASLGYEEIIKGLTRNDSGLLKRTRVKPSIPRTFFEESLEG